MKYLLLLLVLIGSVYAGESYLVCENNNGEYVDSKLIGSDAPELVTIEFNDMLTDKYSFIITLDQKNRTLTANTYEMNSGLLIETVTGSTEYYKPISLVSGYFCQITD